MDSELARAMEADRLPTTGERDVVFTLLDLVFGKHVDPPSGETWSGITSFWIDGKEWGMVQGRKFMIENTLMLITGVRIHTAQYWAERYAVARGHAHAVVAGGGVYKVPRLWRDLYG